MPNAHKKRRHSCRLITSRPPFHYAATSLTNRIPTSTGSSTCNDDTKSSIIAMAKTAFPIAFTATPARFPLSRSVLPAMLAISVMTTSTAIIAAILVPLSFYPFFVSSLICLFSAPDKMKTTRHIPGLVFFAYFFCQFVVFVLFRLLFFFFCHRNLSVLHNIVLSHRRINHNL